MIKILLYFLGFLIGTIFILYITDFISFFDLKKKQEPFANTQSKILKGPPSPAQKGKAIIRIGSKKYEPPPTQTKKSSVSNSALINKQNAGILDNTINTVMRRKSTEEILRENNNNFNALSTATTQVPANMAQTSSRMGYTASNQIIQGATNNTYSTPEFYGTNDKQLKLISSFYELSKSTDGVCDTELNSLVTNNEIFQNIHLIILYSVYSNNFKTNEWIPDNDYDKKLIFTTKCSSASKSLCENVSRETFSLNPYIKGININQIELSGPSCDLLTNNANKNINEFSILFMMKIKGFQSLFNDLIRITTQLNTRINPRSGRPEYIDTSISIAFTSRNKNMQISNASACPSNNEPCKKINNMLSEKINIHNTYYYYDIQKMNYDVNMIEDCNKNNECKQSLPLFKNQLTFLNQLLENEYYNIEIKIGSETFVVYNVSESLFKNDSTLIGLTYKNKKIKFYINNIIHEFDLLDTPPLILAHNIPVIINNNGNIDCILYSFAYYKSAICEKDVHIFKMFNYYYMFGSNKIYDEKQNYLRENTNLKNRIENTQQEQLEKQLQEQKQLKEQQEEKQQQINEQQQQIQKLEQQKSQIEQQKQQKEQEWQQHQRDQLQKIQDIKQRITQHNTMIGQQFITQKTLQEQHNEEQKRILQQQLQVLQQLLQSIQNEKNDLQKQDSEERNPQAKQKLLEKIDDINKKLQQLSLTIQQLTQQIQTLENQRPGLSQPVQSQISEEQQLITHKLQQVELLEQQEQEQKQ